ncbi:MAG: hypothetical protein LBM77_06965 [Spirochaetaceae bacterium]|jgi:predicted nucleic acid-binding protein|nr:hypothetical protein [Spirochaetaceae bacterium]
MIPKPELRDNVLPDSTVWIDFFNPKVKSAEIFRSLRTKGITIRKPNDCLIAAYCILNDLALLHHDRDFDPIEKHFGLQVVR